MAKNSRETSATAERRASAVAKEDVALRLAAQTSARASAVANAELPRFVGLARRTLASASGLEATRAAAQTSVLASAKAAVLDCRSMMTRRCASTKFGAASVSVQVNEAGAAVAHVLVAWRLFQAQVAEAQV
jgi:hypothetical protein